MLTASQTVLDQLDKSVSVSATAGCWMEYNMNDLIEGVSITGPITKNQAGDSTPFVKLFPIKTIIDPRRPKTAGIKYYILNNTVPETLVNYAVAKTLPYRLYYPGEKTVYKYWVSNRSTGSTLTDCSLVVSYPAAKTAYVNKITVKFEVSHSKPTAWTIKIKDLSGTQTTILTDGVVGDNGVVNLYLNNGTWSTSEFSSPSQPAGISEIKVEVTSINTQNTVLGVIEIGGYLIKDVSDRLVSYDIQKSASNGSNEITPVGDVTANSLSLQLNCYDGTGLEYDRTFVFNKDKINLFKNVCIKPFVKIGDTEKFLQGVFYVDSYTLSEYGDVDIQGLDGAKFLQEIITPDILIQDSPSQAIIRRLLDGIGFTNYHFNTTDVDKSTITPYYWYTDDTKTVWQHIQDLCKDTQMIATFDENDILQFYTREYLFQNKTTDLKLRAQLNGSNLENIISMSKETVPSAKAVKILYRPQLSSSFGASSDPLYQAPVITLFAGALINTLPASATPETDAPLGVVYLQQISTYDSLSDHIYYNKSGYLIINHEIIEYDAIKYSYNLASTGAAVERWITSDIDVAKYQGEAKPMSFKPTGAFRIKTRNAFNVLSTPEEHTVNIAKIKENWNTVVFDPKTKQSTTNNSLISLDSSDSQGAKVPRSMLTVNAPSTSGAYTISSTTGKMIASGYDNFSIGTSLYFPLVYSADGRITGNQLSTGGLAFYLNEDSTTGYLLKFGTVQAAVNKDIKQRCVQLLKIKNGVVTQVSDTQTAEDQFQNIVGGQLYKVDIKINKTVSGSTTYLTFKIMVDNTVIYATDMDPLTATNKVGLCSIDGNSRYDYIYTSPISIQEFLEDKTYNLYSGFLGSNSILVKRFADFIIQKGSEVQEAAWIEEFGPVARELMKITSKYNSRPGIPVYPIITMNPFATLVGSSADSFGMEAYVLNNSGSQTRLTDGDLRHFQVIGESIVATDPFEYLDPTLTAIEKQEQFSFESTWIQKETEAIHLSDWMKGIWSKQQQVLKLNIFANPLIQIGDIVEVSYHSNNMYSSEDAVPTGYSVAKYLVLSVQQQWSDGPATNIVCWSIYT